MFSKSFCCLWLAVIGFWALPAWGQEAAQLTKAQKQLWAKTKARLERVYQLEKRVAEPLSPAELEALRLPLRSGQAETGPLPWDMRLLLGFDRNLKLDRASQPLLAYLAELKTPPSSFTPAGVIDFLNMLEDYSGRPPADDVLMLQSFLNRGLGLPALVGMSQIGGDELPNLWLIQSPSGNTPVVHYDYDDMPRFYIRSTSLLDYVACNISTEAGPGLASPGRLENTEDDEFTTSMQYIYVDPASVKKDLAALREPLQILNGALLDTLFLNTGTQEALSRAGPEKIKNWLDELTPVHEAAYGFSGRLAAYREMYGRGNLMAGFHVELLLRAYEDLEIHGGAVSRPKSAQWAEVNRKAGGRQWIEQLAGEGHPESEILLAHILGHGLAGQEKNQAGALAWMSRAAEKNFKRGQAGLASFYLHGQGVEKSPPTAARLFELAAEQGCTASMVNLAGIYLNGSNDEQQSARGIHWLRKAADLGRPEAQSFLASLYANGHGVEQNYPEAARLARLAAGKDDMNAQSLLGVLLLMGIPGQVDKDEAEGFRLIKRAAEQGEAGAQFNLANLYLSGQSGYRDFHQYIRWLKNAAENGLVEGQISLGQVYEKGEQPYFQPNPELAAQWYKKAADQGSAEAAGALRRLTGE